MKRENLSLRLSRDRITCCLVLGVVLLVCLSPPARGQSGRRQGRTASPSPTVPAEPAPEPDARPVPAKLPPVASLIVGGDRLASSFDIQPGNLDIALEACIGKLRRARSLAVIGGGGRMTRKDAVDRAKGQKDTHVVWMEIRVEDHDTSAYGVSIDYTIFMPQTAKVKASGRVYLEGARRGSGKVGVTLPSVMGRLPVEYLMKAGGEGVADRVMREFHLTSPD